MPDTVAVVAQGVNMSNMSHAIAQGEVLDPLGSLDCPGGLQDFDHFMDSLLPPLDNSALDANSADLAYTQGNGEDDKWERKRMKNNEAQRRLRVRKKVGSVASKRVLCQNTLLILPSCCSGASTAT